MSMRGLIKKRDELRLTIRRAKAQLRTIEEAIAVMGGPPPRTHLFGRGEFSRLAYDAMRQGAGDAFQITEYVMAAMDWDTADEALFRDVLRRVKATTRQIAK